MPSAPDAPVHQALFATAAADPGRPFLLLDDGTTVTYGEIDRQAARLATAMTGRGVDVGDRVVVQVPKSVDAVVSYLACLRSGVVFVPLNTAYTAAEVAAFVADAEPALVVDAALLAELVLDATTCEPAPVVHRAGDDPAAMLYTSGTTGRSKGAVLSCRNLVANAGALVDAWRFTADDVLVHVLPVFHVHGLFVALHCASAVGAAVRFHERFDVAAVRRDLRRSTVLMGVPTHYHRLLADPGFATADCEAVRLFTCGSAPLPAAAHAAFAARTGHRIVERYGMTETMILTSNPYDGEPRAGTVGFPLSDVALRVVDDDGAELPPGEPGVVEVQTPGLFLGYWRQPEQTAAAHRDGWFVTGDIGSVDGDRRLTLHGRSSDLIITGGLNVYPSEVEAVLDSVTGVVESAVVGVPDDDLGERVAAVVVVEPGAPVDDDLLAGACEGTLARFKHPRTYVFADALPRNAMGKVLKGALREQLR